MEVVESPKNIVSNQYREEEDIIPQFSNNNDEINKKLDDNLDTVNIKERGLNNNDSQEKLLKLVNSNENFREIYSLLESNNDDKTILNQSKKCSYPERELSKLASVSYYEFKREFIQRNSFFSNRKIDSIYKEISSLSMTHNISKSFGKYQKIPAKKMKMLAKRKKNIFNKLEGFLSKRKELEAKEKKKEEESDSFYDLKAKEKKMSKSSDRFPIKQKEDYIKRNKMNNNINYWIRKQKVSHIDSFYNEKKKELKKLLNVHNKDTNPNSIFNRISNKFLTTYNYQFYNDELKKFSNRLNKRKQTKFTYQAIDSEGLLGNFFIKWKIRLQKQRQRPIF